jgi:hypothetical protein
MPRGYVNLRNYTLFTTLDISRNTCTQSQILIRGVPPDFYFYFFGEWTILIGPSQQHKKTKTLKASQNRSFFVNM